MANKEKKMTRTETRSHSWKELEIPGVRGRLEADGFRFVSRSSDTKQDHYQREVAVDPDPAFTNESTAVLAEDAINEGVAALTAPDVVEAEPEKPAKTKEKKGHA